MKPKSLKRVIFLFLFWAFCAQNAVAGNQFGRITALRVRDWDGLIWVNLEGAYLDKPACAKYSYWMIKNENSETGKRQHAALMAALMSGKRVQIYGNNTCTRWGDGEDINTVEVLMD